MSDDITRISYTCTGGETAFPYPFTIFEPVDLQVFRIRNDISALLSLDIDYTITNDTGPGDVLPLFTVLPGDIIILNLSIPIERTIDYQNGNALNGDTLNEDFDRIYGILRQVNTFSSALSPHYANDSNPQDPGDIILPILGANQYWAKGPSGNGIVAVSTIPDPAASALAAELLSDDPLLGCYIVNTKKNVRVQTFLENINVRQTVASGYAIQLADYGKTISLSSDGESLTLPLISSLPIGWWIKVAYAPIDEQGYISVYGDVADSILLYLNFKLIGANRSFTFSNNGANWDVIDNDYALVGSPLDPFYAKGDGEYLYCDGRAVSRAVYNILFAKLGIAWGAGDGSSTFNIPDARGRSPLGAGTGSGLSARTISQTGGEENHVLTVPELAPHTHGSYFAKPTARGPGVDDVWVPQSTPGDVNVTTGSTGSGDAHNTMHPFYVSYPMIKAF